MVDVVVGGGDVEESPEEFCVCVCVCVGGGG